MASVQRRYISIRFFFRYLIDEGLRDSDPTEGFKFPNPNKPPQRPFSAEELRRMFNVVAPGRNYLLLLFLLSTGCRLSEAWKLRAEDIDGEYIRLYGKGRKERIVSPGPTVMQGLRRYIAGRPGPVWRTDDGRPVRRDTLYWIVRRTGEAVGVHAFPHRFRTTFANMFSASVRDMQSLQVILGHSKIETTMRYAQWSAHERALTLQSRLDLAAQYAS